MCLAIADIKEGDYSDWLKMYEAASTSIDDRYSKVEEAADMIEKVGPVLVVLLGALVMFVVLISVPMLVLVIGLVGLIGAIVGGWMHFINAYFPSEPRSSGSHSHRGQAARGSLYIHYMHTLFIYDVHMLKHIHERTNIFSSNLSYAIISLVSTSGSSGHHSLPHAGQRQGVDLDWR